MNRVVSTRLRSFINDDVFNRSARGRSICKSDFALAPRQGGMGAVFVDYFYPNNQADTTVSHMDGRLIGRWRDQRYEMLVSHDGKLLGYKSHGLYLYDLVERRGIGQLSVIPRSNLSLSAVSKTVLTGKRVFSYARNQSLRYLPLPNHSQQQRYFGVDGTWTTDGRTICALGPAIQPYAMARHRAPGWLVDGQATTDGRDYLLIVNGNQLQWTRPFTLRPLCGNSRLDPGELFDDETVSLENPYRASCGASCGNGRWEQGEGCDDGNHDAGDGCSPLCQVE